MSIVVVSPNQTENAHFEMTLNQGGYPAVVTFTSADEALSPFVPQEEAGLESPPAGMDLLILDVGADPQQLDLIRQLKVSTQMRDVPVVVIFHREAPEVRPMAFAFGANDYLTRPFDDQELIARVRANLILKHEIDRRKAREKELIESSRQLSNLNAWLIRLSVLDSLTKVANRRGFDTALEQEWRRAVRNQTRLTLILIDIDHFNAYNGTYGHCEGDHCLIRVADAIKSSVQRPGDTVARYGGEAFALLLADTTGPGAAYVAEKARMNVEALAIPHPASVTADCVTVSVGVATLEPTQERLSEELVRQADASLQRAKNSGRNRVVTGSDHDAEHHQMESPTSR